MKILYLLYFDLENPQFLGVKKKIIGQCKALKKIGNTVDIAYCYNDKLIILSDESKKEFKCSKGITNYRKSVYELFYTAKFSYDLFYIRFPGTIDYYLYELAKLLKSKNIKCALELPTYPLDGEIKEKVRILKQKKEFLKIVKIKCNYFLHNIFKRVISKTGLKIVTYMPYDKIWNINTIVIDNGIDIDSNGIISSSNENEQQFNITVVANMSKWHGIDRAIRGLKTYLIKNPQNPRNVKLVIVGKGEIEEELKQLVKKEKLEKYVIFKGVLQGEKLDEVYRKTTIALGSLALHRIGLEIGSTLKVKEYCAKGIPFVISYTEKELDDNFKYFLKVPASEEPIDISKCIEFYDSIKKYDYRNEMHRFAEEKYDWKIQMKNILNRI